MIVGIGVDVAEIARLKVALERTPGLAVRLFADSERGRPIHSLAGTFAAKEAVAKALGAPTGLSWHDCEVVSDPDGRPWLTTSGTVLASAAAAGIARWHLSLSHDGGIASAWVIAEDGK